MAILLLLSALGAVADNESIPIQVGQKIQAEIPYGNPYESTVSFDFSASSSGPVTIETRSLEFDTFLRVHRVEDSGEMSLLRIDDDTGTGPNSLLVLEAEAGKHYRIQVKSEDVPYCGGAFEISIEEGRPEKPFDRVGKIDRGCEPGRRSDTAYTGPALEWAESKSSPECRIRMLLSLAWPTDAPEEEAMALFEEALSLAGDLGEDSPARIEASYKNARLMLTDPEKRKESFLEILDAIEKRYGSESFPAGEILFRISNESRRLGQEEEARELYEKALGIYEQALGSTHPQISRAVMLLSGWQIEDKEHHVGVYEALYGPDHPTYARALIDVAANEFFVGDPLRAIERTRRGVAILERAYGADDLRGREQHPRLAIELWLAGNLTEALAIQQDRLSSSRLVLPPDSYSIRFTLIQIAEILLSLGDDRGARSAIAEAASIPGSDKGSQTRMVSELQALFHLRDGEHEKARPMAEASLKERESAFGPQSPFLLWSLELLAEIRSAAGDHDGAGQLLERGLENCERNGLPACVARYHDLIGTLALERSDFEEARASFLLATDLQKKASETAPALAGYVLNLAYAQAGAGEITEAFGGALKAEHLGREHLRMMSSGTAERLALSYASTRSSGADLALSLLSRHAPSLEDGAKRAVDALIRGRSIVLDETAARQHAVNSSTDPEVLRIAEELVRLRTQLSNVTVRGPGLGSGEAYAKLVLRLSEVKDRTEASLAEKSAAFRRQLRSRDIGLDSVKAALPPGTALVSYVRFNDITPASPARAGVPAYMAFITQPEGDEVTLVALGEASRIDDQVAGWRAAVADPETSTNQPGRRLRELIWDPVARHLVREKRVFVVPAGSIHLVNLAALATPDGYLIEKGPLFHYLSAERDLVEFMDRQDSGEGLLALGGVAFDNAGLSSSSSPAASGSGGRRSGCTRFATHSFAPLPGSAAEVRQITSLWSDPSTATRLTGGEATEAAVRKQAPGKRVLHLATHGFFMGGHCLSALEESRGLGGIKLKATGEAPLEGEQPPLLSGLALAGANRRDRAAPGVDDGILTAEEIASLDLAGLEWAVLSACDTGLGNVQEGEGVLGLSRAFRVAGARTLIMSLWSVDDETTRQWMKALYEGRFQEGLDTAEAVRQAGLTVLMNHRKRDQSTHPFYWAAFVAAGDWR